jgi:hypothetical protein
VLFEYVFHFIFGQPAILPQLAPFVDELHPKHMFYVANAALGDNQIEVLDEASGAAEAGDGHEYVGRLNRKYYIDIHKVRQLQAAGHAQ